MVEKLTLGQFFILEVINCFRQDYKRLPYLYEICELTGRKPNHIHCIIDNLVELGELYYPEELLITPTMRDVITLLNEGVSNTSEIEAKLGLQSITVYKVMEQLKDRGLIPDELLDDVFSTPVTYVKVCEDVYITVNYDGIDLILNLNGCCGYLKTISESLKCVIYYGVEAFELDLHPDEVEQIPSYKENENGYTNSAKRDSSKKPKTYIRFHRH